MNNYNENYSNDFENYAVSNHLPEQSNKRSGIGNKIINLKRSRRAALNSRPLSSFDSEPILRVPL